MKTEKERRVYYQDIVYSICAILDQLDGKKPGQGISCGTADEPNTDVLKRIGAMASSIEQVCKWFNEHGLPWIANDFG